MDSETKEIWKLAWPVILTTGASMGLGVVDMIMVGHLGSTAIASLSVSVTWLYAVGVFCRHLSGGVEPLVSQASGENREEVRARLFQHLLCILCIVLFPQMLLYSIAEQGMLFFDQDPKIAKLAGGYCSIIALTVPAELVFFYCMRFFQAMEHVKGATVAVLLANVLNVIANYICIFVLDKGVLGSAMATCVASYGMCFILVFIQRKEIARYLSIRYPFQWSLVKDIWELGWPTGLQISLEVWGFVLSVLFAGWLGVQNQAAHAIVLNFSGLCFMIPLGLSVAAATRVGKLIGEGKDWRKAIWHLGAIMLLVQILIAATISFGAPWIVQAYTSDVALWEIVIPLFYICAIFQVFDGTQAVGLGILRGMGDVKIPLIFHLVAYWIIGIPLALWLAFRADWGVTGLWSGLATALAIIAFLCVLRIRYWMKKGVQSIYAFEK